MRVTLCLLLLTSATACSDVEPDAVEAATTQVTSFYSVDAYDPMRDASADLEVTIARATMDGKRILLEIGGLW